MLPRLSSSNAREDEDFHESLIPKKYYIVEKHAIPKYNPKQYRSTYKDKGYWETIIFPALQPHTRQQVIHLKDTLKAMEKNIKDGSQCNVIEMEWQVYALVFHEAIRQMKFMCKEQSTLVTYLVAQRQNLFQRLLDYVKILQANTSMQPLSTNFIVKTPAPPPTPKPPAKASSTRRPMKTKEKQQNHSDEDSDEEGFICTFCHEYSKDPNKEAVRRNTLLNSIYYHRASTVLEHNSKKLKAVLKLQALFRGFRVRRQKAILDRMRQKTIAATTIQRAFRAFHERKRKISHQKAIETWKKHCHMLMAVKHLQRHVRRFLQVGREYRQGQIGKVVTRFKLADREVALCLEEKCHQIEQVSAKLTHFQNQIQSIESIIQATTTTEDQLTVPSSDSIETQCTIVNSSLSRLHQQVNVLYQRQQHFKQEYEAAVFRLQKLQREMDENAKAKVGFHDDEEEDDWNITLPSQPSLPASSAPIMQSSTLIDPIEPDIAPLVQHNNVAQELYDAMKPLRYGKKWLAHTEARHLQREAAHVAVETPAEEPAVEESKPAKNEEPIVAQGHRGAVLMNSIRRSSAAVEPSRPRRPLGWLKQLLFHIYETVAMEIRDERIAFSKSFPDIAAQLAHQFDLSLTVSEYKCVRAAIAFRDSTEVTKSFSLPDIICHHFQAQYGLPQLVDQAIYDLAIHIHDFALIDHDVQLFQSFLNGVRSKANLLFFTYIRQLCKALVEDNTTSSNPKPNIVPFFDSSSSREMVDLVHAVKVAHILFRVRDESTILQQDPFVDLHGRSPSSLFAQCRAALEARVIVYEENEQSTIYNPLLQPQKFHSHHQNTQASRSPMQRRVHACMPQSLYFTDLFEILCRYHGEVYLHAMYREWIHDTFEAIDTDHDGKIPMQAFISHLSSLPKAPTPRELQQIYRHELHLRLDRSIVP
ncbi:hypothetical protein THRCLA_10020, partial [Thraustotheca clavata]